MLWKRQRVSYTLQKKSCELLQTAMLFFVLDQTTDNPVGKTHATGNIRDTEHKNYALTASNLTSKDMYTF